MEKYMLQDTLAPKRGCVSSHFPWTRKVLIMKYPADLNSTPIVRQYGILLTNGVLFYAKRETK